MKTLLITLALGIFTASTGFSQNLDQQANQSFSLMKQGEWLEAQALLEKTVQAFTPRAEVLGKNKLAVLYYNKGYCELKLSNNENPETAQKYARLAELSFRECQKSPSNPFFAKSHLYLASSLMKQGNYTTALGAMDNFLKVYNPEKDSFDKGTFTLNRAICHFKLAAAQAD